MGLRISMPPQERPFPTEGSFSCSAPHYQILVKKSDRNGISLAYIPEVDITKIMGYEVFHATFIIIDDQIYYEAMAKKNLLT